MEDFNFFCRHSHTLLYDVQPRDTLNGRYGFSLSIDKIKTANLFRNISDKSERGNTLNASTELNRTKEEKNDDEKFKSKREKLKVKNNLKMK